MTTDELRQAAAALVARTTTAQALPRLVADLRLLARAAAMVTPPPATKRPRRRRAA